MSQLRCLLMAIATLPLLVFQLAAQAPTDPASTGNEERKEGKPLVPPPVDREKQGRDDEREARIRAIEDALWKELSELEQRLRRVKGQLESDGERRPARPEPDRKGPVKAEPRRAVSLEDRHQQLHKKQDELVLRWKELQKQKGVDTTRDDEAEKKRARQSLEVENDLRGVLHDLLELRESSRERQIHRLRVELDSLKRSLDARSSRWDRERGVELKLRELLGPTAPAPAEQK